MQHVYIKITLLNTKHSTQHHITGLSVYYCIPVTIHHVLLVPVTH